MNGRIVKFNALTDTDRTCAQNHDFFFIGEDGCVLSGVGGIEIRDICARMAGINHAIHREHGILFSDVKNLYFGFAPKLCDYFITEAKLFSFGKNFQIADGSLEFFFHCDNIRKSLKEITSNACYFKNIVYRNVATQKFTNCKNVIVLKFLDILKYISGFHIHEFRNLIVVSTCFKRTNRFQEALLEVRANAHDFTGSLHLSAKSVRCSCKFIKGKTRKLCNHVIEGRLECSISVGNSDIFKCHTNRNLCSYTCNGISACFRCKSTGTGNARIYLDEIILAGVRIESELYVTATFDFKFTNNLNSAIVKHFKVMVVKRHNRCNNHRVAGMYANRVYVFHTANGDSVVIGVAHNLKFDLLITLYTLFYKNLMYGRELECVETDFHKFLFVISKTAACTAQSECRTKNNRITDLCSSLLGFFYAISDFGGNGRFADRLAELLEQFSIFGSFYAFAAGSKQFNVTFSKNAFFLQLHCKVETGLSADAGKNSIGTFITKNLRNIFKSKRFHINLICNSCVGHDSGRV